jgi:hypothetical protein
MTTVIDADVILTAAEPLVHQHAPEIRASWTSMPSSRL